MTQGRSDVAANIGRIITAARKVFAKEGAAATMSRVASAAGVSDATLYRHFPNRQVLAAAVYEDIFVSQVKPAILALCGNPAPELYVDALVHLEDVMFEQRPLLASLDDLANLTADFITRDRDLFDDIILQCQASGILRPDLTADEVATFVAMVTTASVAMNQPKPARRRYLRLMVDALTLNTTSVRASPSGDGQHQGSHRPRKSTRRSSH
ncbi:TetR/AcrR family transcriptional regulator [Mycobacterium sp.]|uniref:TetR/AcrR family transcriptional regulator n=1 Tax=Mycobacterium sp. TaxID=1785 RepID=UPI003C72B1E3